MKKLFLLPHVIALALLSSSLAYADDDDWGDGDDQGYYVQPQINYYYSPPPPPPPQVYNYYRSPRSTIITIHRKDKPTIIRHNPNTMSMTSVPTRVWLAAS